jgi:gliding motility-associated-like protein
LDAGAYTDIAIEAAGCVTVLAGPFTLTDPATPNAPTAGADATYCEGDVVADLTASGGAGTLDWYDDVTLANNVGTGGTYTPATSVGTFTYYVTESDSGCTSAASLVTITINAVPAMPTIDITTPVCAGETVTISTPDAGDTYNWNGPSGFTSGAQFNTIATATTADSGTYTLTVTVNGCTSPEASGDLVVNEVIAAFTPSSLTGEIPLDVIFTNNSTGAASYAWDFDDGNTSTATDPTNTFTDLGDYMVTLTATDGLCSDVATITITTTGVSVLTVPNVFSPNGDGINDQFIIAAENLTTFNGTIYNRWGETIFIMQDPSVRWDGYTNSGIQVPEGTYYYVITAERADGEPYKFAGHVTLTR